MKDCPSDDIFMVSIQRLARSGDKMIVFLRTKSLSMFALVKSNEVILKTRNAQIIFAVSSD